MHEADLIYQSSKTDIRRGRTTWAPKSSSLCGIATYELYICNRQFVQSGSSLSTNNAVMMTSHF